MMAGREIDLKGDALKAQRFQMLEDIAAELSGEVVFPTCFDVAMRIRKALQDPELPLDALVAQIGVEPLIGTKLLQLANSVAYNPQQVEVRDVRNAIQRLGLDMVRNTTMAVAMAQMLRARDMADFADIARNLWMHTQKTAAACHVIARRLSRVNPDEAMFAGLVHDLGAFYMLYRATQYDELRARPQTLRYLIARWHESIGLAVLSSMGVPEDIVESIRDHDVLRRAPVAPKNLRDIVYVANFLAGGLLEWKHLDVEPQDLARHAPGEPYLALQDEIDMRTNEMLAVFG